MQIILKLTTACNLNCVCCGEGDCELKVLPKENFFKLVDELPPVLEQLQSKDAEFLFHGGEPTLYGRENLKNLIDYAKNNLSDYKVRFLMQTNGTLIDEDWIKFFKEENISVGVSLDGYSELHDKNRRTKNDEPTAVKIFRRRLPTIHKVSSADFSVSIANSHLKKLREAIRCVTSLFLMTSTMNRKRHCLPLPNLSLTFTGRSRKSARANLNFGLM